MQNKKGIAFVGSILILAIIAIAGGVGYFFLQKKPEQKSERNLELTIRTQKDTYKVGEIFQGDYWLKYEGQPFSAIVTYDEYKKGFEHRDLYGKSAGIIKNGDFDSNLGILRQELAPINLNATAKRDYFEAPGEYVYTMSVYECENIGLKKNCSAEAITAEFLSNFKPLKLVSKTITVLEEDTSKEKTTLPPVPTSVPINKTVLDCYYGLGAVDYNAQCVVDFFNLFKKNLQSCIPSKGTTGIGFETAGGLAEGFFRNYEIIGVKNNLCAVKFSFLKTQGVDATILGKEMICEYGDAERTGEKVASMQHCTGPLYDMIQKAINEQ